VTYTPVTLLATSSGKHPVLQSGKHRARLGRANRRVWQLRSRTVERVGVTDADATVTALGSLRTRKANTALLELRRITPMHPLKGKCGQCQVT